MTSCKTILLLKILWRFVKPLVSLKKTRDAGWLEARKGVRKLDLKLASHAAAIAHETTCFLVVAGPVNDLFARTKFSFRYTLSFCKKNREESISKIQSTDHSYYTSNIFVQININFVRIDFSKAPYFKRKKLVGNITFLALLKLTRPLTFAF